MSGALFSGWRPSGPEKPVLQGWVEATQHARPADAPLPRWRHADQWHITLCFIGYHVDAGETERARRVLGSVGERIPPHAIRIERLAHWRGRRSMPVVALPTASPELQALCDACRDALNHAGIRPLQATTTPHVTLGYFDGGTPLQHWMSDVRHSARGLAVERFDLLFNSGGRYESLASWPLTGSALPPLPGQGSLL